MIATIATIATIDTNSTTHIATHKSEVTLFYKKNLECSFEKLNKQHALIINSSSNNPFKPQQHKNNFKKTLKSSSNIAICSWCDQLYKPVGVKRHRNQCKSKPMNETLPGNILKRSKQIESNCRARKNSS